MSAIERPPEAYACCGDLSLRRYIARNGAVQLRWQCAGCGDLRGSAVKQAEAHRYVRGPIPLVDEAVRAAVKDAERAEREQLRADWWAWYDEYLRSPAWAYRRRMVIKRCQNVCEGCADAPVEHVHHLTYDDVGRELLFQLVGLCRQCHDQAHSTNPHKMPFEVRLAEVEEANRA